MSTRVRELSRFTTIFTHVRSDVLVLMQADERPLTRNEAAHALGGLSLGTLDKLISSGELVATRIGRRVVIQPQHLREFLERKVNAPSTHDVSRHEQTHAALRVLAGVKAVVVDDDPDAMLQALRGSAREVSLRLAEATSLLAHLCRLSGQPEATLAGLVEAVHRAV